ncbi:MAG TPA: CSLREA domain-containing protein, partial [Polyangiaceae bacterium]|nr:CSLREA domain-containing protein [Polyangiaceae bacterium]
GEPPMLRRRISATLGSLLLSTLIAAAPAIAATITVTTLVDELNADGDCSLREALQAANTNAAVDACTAGAAGLDTVVLPAGVIPLSVTISVSDAVIVRGAGRASTTINRGAANAFNGPGVAGATLTLEDLSAVGSVNTGGAQDIAVTRVDNEATTSQEPANTGIEVIKSDGAGGWLPSETVVPPSAGANRFTPSFVPDSSFLLYTQAECPGGDHAAIDCDANADSTARTYAVKPATGASPILLANAGSPGVSDGAATALADTLPKTSPFQTKQGKGKLFWYTVASRREPGLRKRTGTGQQLLWMFAVNPAEVLAGKDGSYTGFFLPFQDLQTSNHLGQWTEKVVSAVPPPPPPAPPPPPPPPTPPVPR